MNSFYVDIDKTTHIVGGEQLSIKAVGSDSKSSKSKESYSLWASSDETIFYPVSKTYSELPPDIYEFQFDNSGRIQFIRIKSQ